MKTAGAHALNATPLHVEVEVTVTEAALTRVLPRLLAMKPEAVRDAEVNLTVLSAVAIAAAENVLDRRSELDARVREVPWAVIEGIDELAHAAQHADLRLRATRDDPTNFADLLPRANELRGLMLLDLAAQVRRRRAPERLLEDVRGGDNSVRDKANDLNDMAGWYAAHWPSVEGRTTVEPAELTEAASLATQMLARLAALAASRAPREGELAPEELRRRALTALLDDYAVVRRYGAFLFWDAPEGWEAYVPALDAGRH